MGRVAVSSRASLCDTFETRTPIVYFSSIRLKGLMVDVLFGTISRVPMPYFLSFLCTLYPRNAADNTYLQMIKILRTVSKMIRLRSFIHSLTYACTYSYTPQETKLIMIHFYGS